MTSHRTSVHTLPTYELPEIDQPWTARRQRPVTKTARPSKRSAKQPSSSRSAVAPARGGVGSRILYLLWALAALLFLTRIALGASLDTTEPWSEASIAASEATLTTAPERCATAALGARDIGALTSLRQELGTAGEYWGAPLQISIVLHVIQPGKKVLIKDWQIKKQMQLLDKTFAGGQISFRLAEVRRVVNADFYAGCGAWADQAMKDALAVDTHGTVNVYVCKPKAGWLGLASLPRSFDEGDSRHSVIINERSLPAKKMDGYNEGDTLVHEMGHYLGLYHTFEFGCDMGDYVGDTEPENVPTTGCPKAKDTCAGGTTDPVQNFMDYSTDTCMTSFTSGQFGLMQQSIDTWRPSLRNGG